MYRDVEATAHALLKNIAVGSWAVALVIAVVAIRSFFGLYGWNFQVIMTPAQNAADPHAKL